MISLKTNQEIAVMEEGGRRLARVLAGVLKQVKPGVTKVILDQIAEKEIKNQEGLPSFKMVPDYHWSTCITINNEVVHGIPGNQEIKAGDIVGVDVGTFYQGFHTDVSWTMEVESNKKSQFLEAGQSALKKAIQEAQVGKYIGDISRIIQTVIEGAGYSPVRVLTGHGIGRKLHEDPAIPGFLQGGVNQTPKLRAGMTLAIEVIYNQGSPEVVLGDDGWTIFTKDGKISALFEQTVAITENGPLILTK